MTATQRGYGGIECNATVIFGPIFRRHVTPGDEKTRARRP
ncbi:hypothetical protein L843_0790 [Mycobacterium intracellulare MIN_061107_1834]|nr:hypothetical protein L843_0790 [Mycobacterium intracellulare MIN_061107_1834]